MSRVIDLNGMPIRKADGQALDTNTAKSLDAICNSLIQIALEIEKVSTALKRCEDAAGYRLIEAAARTIYESAPDKAYLFRSLLEVNSSKLWLWARMVSDEYMLVKFTEVDIAKGVQHAADLNQDNKNRYVDLFLGQD